MTMEQMLTALASGPGEVRIFRYQDGISSSNRWFCEVIRKSVEGSTELRISEKDDTPDGVVQKAYAKFEALLKPDGMRRELMRAIEHHESDDNVPY